MLANKVYWSEGGAWVRVPVPSNTPCCVRCIIAAQMPFWRGIPVGSIPLPEAEKNALCAKMAGHWQVQQLGFDASSPAINRNMFVHNYTDIEIRGDTMFTSGGMHNVQTEYSEISVSNATAEIPITPFRGTDGRLYLDSIGSFIKREDDGEMEIHHAGGHKMLLQRGWKRSGTANPNSAAPIAQGVAVAAAHAPGAIQMDRLGAEPLLPAEETPTEKILGLKKLLDAGALTQEEFDKKKTELLGQM
jgi:hypothetical protein